MTNIVKYIISAFVCSSRITSCWLLFMETSLEVLIEPRDNDTQKPRADTADNTWLFYVDFPATMDIHVRACSGWQILISKDLLQTNRACQPCLKQIQMHAVHHQLKLHSGYGPTMSSWSSLLCIPKYLESRLYRVPVYVHAHYTETYKHRTCFVCVEYDVICCNF